MSDPTNQYPSIDQSPYGQPPREPRRARTARPPTARPPREPRRVRTARPTR